MGAKGEAGTEHVSQAGAEAGTEARGTGRLSLVAELGLRLEPETDPEG